MQFYDFVSIVPDGRGIALTVTPVSFPPEPNPKAKTLLFPSFHRMISKLDRTATMILVPGCLTPQQVSSFLWAHLAAADSALRPSGGYCGEDCFIRLAVRRGILVPLDARSARRSVANRILQAPFALLGASPRILQTGREREVASWRYR